MGQTSFSVSTNKSIYLNDFISVTITARNFSDTTYTLEFYSGCEADFSVDTLDWMVQAERICDAAFHYRNIPTHDSIVWGASYFENFITGANLGLGKHALTASLLLWPQMWVSDTLWIMVTNPTSVNNNSEIPDKYVLNNNYPNPFNPTTQISYTLAKASNVTLKIYNVLGQQIATLVNGKNEPGEHSVSWNALNVPSGVYFYRIVAGDFMQTKKMVLMK